LSLFSSLTNRIFVASALLAVFPIAIGIYHVNSAVGAQAEEELLRGLAEARTLIEENRRAQVENFTRDARLIADLSRLKAAVGDADSLTGVRRAVSGQETSSFVTHTGGILHLVSVPIWIRPALEAPEILGTLSIGFSLDRRAAARFRLLTNSDIAFGVGDTIEASTLPPSSWKTLASLLAHDGLSKQVLLDDNNYIAITVPMSPDVDSYGPQRAALGRPPTAAKAIILRSRSERLAFLGPLHTSMLVIAGLAVLAATVLSYGIARTVTRPLGVITATMREMAATGDLTRKIPVAATPHWEDEDARLLASTFNTMTDSIARFQHEAAQRERLSSLGRLSTVVAHEIRNPLMIIKAALRGLRRGGLSPDGVSTAVADIDEEIVRLNRIVSEVLDFAKPIRFEMADADINGLCADAVKASGAEGEPLRATLRLDGSLPPIVTDAERLRLVLVNVLTNARHAVAARDCAAVDGNAITMTTERCGAARVAIEVRDRGTGISADNLARIFDPYFTTRRTGTGLGLAISRNIIEGLRGTIAVTSRSGEGTTVRIELPLL
jgi:signal transduction histidine kinase